jgi:TonB family protein
MLCVCIDEKGTLTRDPVIAESSGDSRVDSGAVKMARSDSGRYKPPIVNGQPQRACFRFAIDFKHQQ